MKDRKKTALICCVVAMLLWPFLGDPAEAAEERDLTIAGKQITEWDDARPGKKPVLFFSHGFHGCSTQARRLMNAFADHGYLVFAPNHKDAVCHNGESQLYSLPEVPFRKAMNWDETIYADRGEDLRRLMEALKKDTFYAERIDWNQMGLVGHSLGGYTVLALAGAWPSWAVPGIKAVLAYSPYCLPFVQKQTLNKVTAPVMYQGGTNDRFITPSVKEANGCYDQSPSPKYFVEFDGASHFSWADLRAQEDQTSILVYSLAFLDRYVRGAAPSVVLSAKAGNAILLKRQEK